MGWAKNRSTVRRHPKVKYALTAEARGRSSRPPLVALLRRPVSLLSLPPSPVVLFVAGAIAGAAGKTLVAPLDRVKILLQVRGGLERGAVREAAVRGGILRSLWAICKTEGVLGFWKGNIPQLLRVVPYSAVQLGSYELLKRMLRNDEGELPVLRRLAAGALAGMCSTFVTYPLDTLRFRLAVDPEVKTVQAACRVLMKESGIWSFYRGLKPALWGIAPYMAIELASFDLLPHSVPSFVRGFAAALIATSMCYPLDTIRRRGQLVIAEGVSYRQITRRMLENEGLGGMYRGFLPNAIKNLPNKGIRLSMFEAVKSLQAVSHEVYAEEAALYNEQRKTQESLA